uniref:Uncharacterized LOC100178972 n=1 Tax=Ciona intestinalis TaxID=7719 RepID=H2Y0P0_CIOIN|nr:uncharacterized protein LOC100178972 [Ciona intestinalis]|eukprot:XP_002128587.1 uncharacterized protein LOC100178972 [Ciona intestinalis]
MTSQRSTTRTSVVVSVLVLLFWCQVFYTSKADGATVELNREAKVRSKRHVADMLITEKVSRVKRGHNKNLLLSRILQLTDASTGGHCQCILQQKAVKQGCECNEPILYLRMIRKITDPKMKLGHGSDATELDRLLARMKPNMKRAVLHLAINEFQRLLREVEVERTRRGRIIRQLIRRRRKLRHHPRSAFDGKQLFSF